MPCFNLRQAFFSRLPNEKGRYFVVFGGREADLSRPTLVRCSSCLGCRAERARQRAVQCLHESSLHDSNLFVTLTYDEGHVLSSGSLSLEHCQLFFKRFRKRRPIRYLIAGEYGPQTRRPHYHAIFFGVSFSDAVLFKRKGDHDLYSSRELDSIWTHGHCDFGAVNFASASYAAGYALKKIRQDWSSYLEVDEVTGEITSERLKPFITSSNRPGLGFGWYQKFKKDCFPSCSIAVDGRLQRPPQYYFRLLEREDPALYSQVIANSVLDDNFIRLDDPEFQRKRSIDKATVAASRLSLYSQRGEV